MSARLSVVVPFYDHQDYIAELLRSVVAAGDSIHELIVLNDGSRQDPRTQIEEITRATSGRLKVVYEYQDNAGLTVTLNRLIAMSTGDIVAVIASDDVLIPETVSERLRLFEKNTACDAIVGDALVIDSDGTVLATSAMSKWFNVDTRTASLGPNFTKKEFIYNWGIPGPCLMVRKTVYADIGGYDEGLRVEDRDFYLRLLAKKNVHFYDRPVAMYRVHGANTAGPSNRDWVLKEVSDSNIRHAHLYDLPERMYLGSYRVDRWAYSRLAPGKPPAVATIVRSPAIGLRAALRFLWRLRVAASRFSRQAPRDRAASGGIDPE